MTNINETSMISNLQGNYTFIIAVPCPTTGIKPITYLMLINFS